MVFFFFLLLLLITTTFLEVNCCVKDTHTHNSVYSTCWSSKGPLYTVHIWFSFYPYLKFIPAVFNAEPVLRKYYFEFAGFFAECGGCKQKPRRENKLNNCNVCLYSAEDADKYIPYWCLGKHHKCNNKGTAHNINKGRIDWIIHIGWQMHIYVWSHTILTSFRLTHNVLLCVII